MALGALYFLPPYFQTRSHEIPLFVRGRAERFPLEGTFTQVKNGKPSSKIKLSDLVRESNNGIIVNFWATWCPPCLDELPSLEMLQRQLRAERGALPRLVTISVDERISDIDRLFHTLDFNPSFLILFDSAAELSRAVGTTKFPETYWLGKDGTILYKWIGPQNWLDANVLNKIRQLSSNP